MKQQMVRTSLAAIALGLLSISAAQAQRFDSLSKAEGVTLSSFEKVYIAPVSVDLAAGEAAFNNDQLNFTRSRLEPPEISESDKEANASELQQDLTRAFGKKFTLVEEPGEGVLTVDATITHLIASRPTPDRLRANPGLDPLSISAGGASYYIQLKEQDVALVEIADRDQSSLRDRVPRIRIWQDAERSFGEMARNLTRYVSKN